MAETYGLLRSLFDAQHRASRQAAFPTLAERRVHLAELDRLLRKNADAFGQAIAEDFGGRPEAVFLLAELAPLLDFIRLAKRRLPRWMRPDRRAVPLQFRPGRAWVQYQPLGCVGIIAPWNYPLLLSVSPLIDALAAGNRVLLKPSELTPRFAALLTELIGRAFAPTHVAVVQGDATVAAAFAALPFDHLLFTGSTARGRDVMRAAAENLTPLTLELGGKSPVIVCGDYPLAEAARRIAAGKLFNAGQTCLAPDYVLTMAGRAQNLGEAIFAHFQKALPQSATSNDLACVINDHHADRLRAAIMEAEGQGARVLRMPDAGRRIGPTVILNPPFACELMREEIFGPILPVIDVASLDDAIAFMNARPRPLALYPFTQDRATLNAILTRALSGGVTWNNTILHCALPDLPFGGVGASGFGAYHGEAGFRRFSHARAVYRSGRFSGFSWFAPPYTGAKFVMLRMLRKRLKGAG